MKRAIGAILIGVMVLASGPAVFARGHGRPGPSYYHHPTQHNRHHHSRSWTGRDTFAAVCAGVIGVGLIAAAASEWGRPVYYTTAYCPPPPPPPPPPVYPAPVYYVPVYR